jgi:hypothetical protein
LTKNAPRDLLLDFQKPSFTLSQLVKSELNSHLETVFVFLLYKNNKTAKTEMSIVYFLVAVVPNPENPIMAAMSDSSSPSIVSSAFLFLSFRFSFL